MAFAQKILKNGHANRARLHGHGIGLSSLFPAHLRPIEKDNVRNRRRHSFEYIRTRLVQMDFILANLGHEYLETESDKVHLFCE